MKAATEATRKPVHDVVDTVERIGTSAASSTLNVRSVSERGKCHARVASLRKVVGQNAVQVPLGSSKDDS